jgi:uncharacterized peroxidase-related enzyme
MPHINLPEHLPGITGLLEYRKDSADPIRNLTQILLRGENTLSVGERELIATIVSHGNECKFCTAAHASAATILLDDTAICEMIKDDIMTSSVSEKMKGLLKIAQAVQKNGKQVTTEMINIAKRAGATDMEIHDTVLIAALFCLYNKYVDGLATIAPKEPEFYEKLGERITTIGYVRLPQGYDHLKK